jgi:ABC-type dipeptide/oligopeptide/nickel transport system ATPase component
MFVIGICDLVCFYNNVQENVNMLLEIKNLSSCYHQNGKAMPILRDIALAVEKGEAIGIIGESGSGKTTLVDAVLGILKYKGGSITRGDILFEGSSILESQKNVVGTKIAYIPQDPNAALDPLFPIATNFREMLRVHKNMRAQDIITKETERLLEEVHLSVREISLQSYPHQLSGGMKQRVLIALSLISQPQLIIADEPTSDLDVTLEVEIMELLEEIKEKQKTSFLFATHNLHLARAFCARIYVMNSGQIVESGPSCELFKNPQHLYTKMLMSSLLPL